MRSYKIEEAAAMTGLTKRAIRYYEELELIAAPERTEGGIRMYTEDDIERLRKIVLAKEVLGFSLQELQQFLKMNELLDRQRQVARSAEDRSERRRQLEEMAKTLRNEIGLIGRKMDRMRQFRQELEEMERRVAEAIDRYADA